MNKFVAVILILIAGTVKLALTPPSDEKVRDSVVALTQDGRRYCSGVEVYYDKAYYILTAAHCLNRAVSLPSPTTGRLNYYVAVQLENSEVGFFESH